MTYIIVNDGSGAAYFLFPLQIYCPLFSMGLDRGKHEREETGKEESGSKVLPLTLSLWGGQGSQWALASLN